MPIIDVGPTLGVPAFLNSDDGSIEFLVPVEATKARTLGELVDAGVVRSRHVGVSAGERDEVVTVIYRLVDDERVLDAQGLAYPEESKGLKFDVTSILPDPTGRWTGEYPKTIGHYHTSMEGIGVPSPDFYQVVYGQGIILLQCPVDRRILTYGVKVREGDCLLIPPHLGHISVNTGNVPLVFANVCVRRPHLDYESITRLGGGAFLVVPSPDRPGWGIEENPSYAQHGLRVSPLEWLHTNYREMENLEVTRGVPIYNCILSTAAVLRVLTAPHEFATTFTLSLSASGGSSDVP